MSRSKRRNAEKEARLERQARTLTALDATTYAALDYDPVVGLALLPLDHSINQGIVRWADDRKQKKRRKNPVPTSSADQQRVLDALIAQTPPYLPYLSALMERHTSIPQDTRSAYSERRQRNPDAPAMTLEECRTNLQACIADVIKCNQEINDCRRRLKECEDAHRQCQIERGAAESALAAHTTTFRDLSRRLRRQEERFEAEREAVEEEAQQLLVN